MIGWAGLGGFGAGDPVPAAATLSTPSNPTGTNSATGKMMGLAGTITPVITGRVLIIVSGTVANDTINKANSMMIHTGTGAAPANGDAPAGTGRGITRLTGAHTAQNEEKAFVLQALVTGLDLNEAIWIDVHLISVAGGIASLTNLTISAIEL
jgi:hypothetical protein